MDPILFSKPIHVKDTTLLVCEIACLADALDFLAKWPEARRGPIYEVATRACHAAHDRLMPVDGAYRSFVCFARSVGILDEESATPPGAYTNEKAGSPPKTWGG